MFVQWRSCNRHDLLIYKKTKLIVALSTKGFEPPAKIDQTALICIRTSVRIRQHADEHVRASIAFESYAGQISSLPLEPKRVLRSEDDECVATLCNETRNTKNPASQSNKGRHEARGYG